MTGGHAEQLIVGCEAGRVILLDKRKLHEPVVLKQAPPANMLGIRAQLIVSLSANPTRHNSPESRHQQLAYDNDETLTHLL